GMGQANTPWSSKANADAFINSFISAASNTGSFSQDQMENMSLIGNTLMAAMDNMGGRITPSKLQALDMAFASSVAQIAASQGGDLGVTTNAIADALTSAFYQTTGVVNSRFISEIRSLIGMFAQASANDVYASAGSG
uniref:Major ampullate spidroin 1 n=1 Tax=Latrodectus hesperus TaxID=256737 RepID=UPI0007DB6ABA|nr:Chain A, Major ampullate spidroin 1 [Latrodectus hesperus]